MPKKYMIIICILLISILSACSNGIVTPTISTDSVSSSSTSDNSLSASQSEYYSDEPVSEPYTGTYEPEVWVDPLEEPPTAFEQMLSGPVTVRQVDIEDTIQIPGAYPMPPISNTVPLEQVMSTVNESAIYSELWNAARPIWLRDYHPNVLIEEANIPVSFLRNTADGVYYTVNKLVNGGYVYFYFERNTNWETLEIATDDLTDVRLTGCVYMEKKLDRSAFKNIAIGDSIDDVIAIDNVAIFSKLMSERAYIWFDDITIEEKEYSVHLLEDGLLTICYVWDGTELVIDSIEFSEDFIFYPPYSDLEIPKHYSILPQDYPPET